MTAQEKFWNWFIQHQVDLLDFEADREKVFDKLAVELQKVDPDLTFEFGPKSTKREFVISAGGIKRAFPAVASLVGAAPILDRWRLTAFRPRRTHPSIVEFRGKRVHAEDVQFSLLHSGTTVGIYLFIPGFNEDDTDLKQIGYLLLNESLGEYDVESRLGLIEMLSPDTRTGEDRYPITELAARFDELVSQLEGHTKKPS